MSVYVYERLCVGLCRTVCVVWYMCVVWYVWCVSMSVCVYERLRVCVLWYGNYNCYHQ